MQDTHELEQITAELKKLQEYVAEANAKRGFENESVQDRFILLVEEIGELAKSLRPLNGVKVANDSLMNEIEHELADVLLLVISLSNKLDIDLAKAVQSKEVKNQTRTWT